MQKITTENELKDLYNFVFLYVEKNEGYTRPGLLGLELFELVPGLKKDDKGAIYEIKAKSCVFSWPLVPVDEFIRVKNADGVTVYEPNYFIRGIRAGALLDVKLKIYMNGWHLLELPGVKFASDQYTIRELIILLSATLSSRSAPAPPLVDGLDVVPIAEKIEEKKEIGTKQEPKQEPKETKKLSLKGSTGEKKKIKTFEPVAGRGGDLAKSDAAPAPVTVEIRGALYTVRPLDGGQYEVIKEKTGRKMAAGKLVYNQAVLLYECG